MSFLHAQQSVLGAAGGVPTAYPDPSGWTLCQEWDTRVGDLAGIQAQFTDVRANSLGWSPDGTRLTLGSSANADDKFVTYNCSTPFDPDTAVFSGRQRSITNPFDIKFGDGTYYYFIQVVGDEISQYLSGSGGYWLGSGAELSDLTKANVGFDSSTDGPFILAHDSTYIIWLGRNNTTGDRLKIIDIPGGDLDLWSLFDEDAYAHSVSSVLQCSPLSLDGINWYNTAGSQGVRLLTLQGFKDASNSVAGAYTTAAAMGVTNGLRPEAIWVDPFDTTLVWVIDSSGGQNDLQIACLNTNA